MIELRVLLLEVKGQDTVPIICGQSAARNCVLEAQDP
jgi:hypothetical protein